MAYWRPDPRRAVPSAITRGRRRPFSRKIEQRKSFPLAPTAFGDGFMRQIGTLDTEQNARVLEDYLLTRGIASRVLPGRKGWEVWVHDESQVEPAKEEFDRFRHDPEDARYREAAPAASAIRTQVDRDEARHRKNLVDVRKRWERPAAGFRPVTFALIAGSVLVAALTRLGRDTSRFATYCRSTPFRSWGEFHFPNPDYSPTFAAARSGGWSRRSSCISARSTSCSTCSGCTISAA
jgi:hypothetical protein